MQKKQKQGTNKVFLSSDNDNQEEIKDQDGDNERKMKDFEENDFLTSIMFSMKTPRAIVEALKVDSSFSLIFCSLIRYLRSADSFQTESCVAVSPSIQG